jgi:O-antigen ligase
VSAFLTPLLQLQRFFLPTLFILIAWAIWRTVFKKDLAVGLAFYLGLVIVADGFLNTGIYLPGLEKGSIRYSEVCAAVLLLNRPAAGSLQTLPRSVLFLIGLYFSLMLMSALRADSVIAAVHEFRGVIVPQVVAVMVAIRGFAEWADYRRFILHLTAVVMLVGVFNFWDVFFDIWVLYSDSLNTGKYTMTRKQGRFGSLFLNPNMLGAFVVLVFPMTFIWAMNERNRWLRLYAALSLLALAFCLVKTQSRGPLLAFVVGVALLAIGPCGAVSRPRRLGFLMAFVLLFAAFMPGFYRTAVERFDAIDREMTTEAARSRQTVWVYSQRMISENPLGGIGFGEKQFLLEMDRAGFATEYGGESLDNPHNSYLQIAVYAGVPALIIFLLANVSLLGRAVLTARRGLDPETTPVVFALTVGLAGFLAAAYPDMHLFTRDVAPVYWVFFGLLFALTMRTPARVAAPAPSAVPAAVPVSFVEAFQARRRLELPK